MLLLFGVVAVVPLTLEMASAFLSVFNFSIFFLRNMMSDANSLSSRALFARMVSPAVEKILSEGAELAGIARYFLANALNIGYLLELCFHQCKGSLSTGIVVEFKNLAYSCLTISSIPTSAIGSKSTPSSM